MNSVHLSRVQVYSNNIYMTTNCYHDGQLQPNYSLSVTNMMRFQTYLLIGNNFLKS
jgi:hypothetical protein